MVCLLLKGFLCKTHLLGRHLDSQCLDYFFECRTLEFFHASVKGRRNDIHLEYMRKKRLKKKTRKKNYLVKASDPPPLHWSQKKKGLFGVVP